MSNRKARAIRMPPPITKGSMWLTLFIKCLYAFLGLAFFCRFPFRSGRTPFFPFEHGSGSAQGLIQQLVGLINAVRHPSR